MRAITEFVAYQVRGQQLLPYQHPGHTLAGLRIPDSLSRYLHAPMHDSSQLKIWLSCHRTMFLQSSGFEET